MTKTINFVDREYNSLQKSYLKLTYRYNKVQMRLEERKLGLISGYFIVKGWIS
jgi:hypothetical protein